MSKTTRYGWNKIKEAYMLGSPDGSHSGKHCNCDYCVNLNRFKINKKEIDKLIKLELDEKN